MHRRVHHGPAAGVAVRRYAGRRGLNPAPAALRLAAIPGLTRDLRLLTHDPARDLVSATLHRERCWEPFESRLLLACLERGGIALDVGANLGYFSLLFALAQRAPSRVFAFEPAADNYALLTANLRLNDCQRRVVALPLALGEADSPGVLHRSVDNLGDHRLFGGDAKRSREGVAVRRGADILASEGVDRIAVLKVDTQGTEMAVLRGLLPLLERSADRLRALVELTPRALRAAGSSGRELVTLLADLDLPLAIVDHIGGRVVPESAAALCRWCDNVDAVPGDRGFMNIFAGSVPEGFG